MKTKLLSFVSILVISFAISCQNGDKSEINSVKPKKSTGAARKACFNAVSYRWFYPDNDYTYDGCLHYYVHRGSTRQFKVLMSNSASYAQNITIRIDHPDNPSHIQYSVASFTGGSISIVNPIPGAAYGESIRWAAANMPAYTTYELILNVTGVIGSGGAENGVSLRIESPCTDAPNIDCEADENLHLLLVN